MANTKNSRLWWQISLAAFLLIIIAVIAFDYWVKARVKHEIENLSGRKLNGLYSLHIGKTYVDIWNGELQASDISLQSDTAAWHLLRHARPDSLPPLFFLTANSILVKRFHWLQYLAGRKAAARSVVLDQPRLTLFAFPDSTAAEVSIQERLLKLPELISPLAVLLKIKNLSVNNADILLNTIRAPGDTLRQEIQQADLYAKDLYIGQESEEISCCKELEIRARQIASVFNRGTQKISFDDFKFSKNSRYIQLHNFTVEPQRSEAQFFNEVGVRRAYFSMKCPELELQGFDLDRWLAYDYLHARSLRLQEPVLQFTINKHLPLPYRKLLPHELIQKINGLFNVEQVIVKNGHIQLMNRVPGRDFTVTFDHAYITANNFSNDSLLMDDIHPLEIWAESRFMDQAPIKLKMNIPLLSPNFDADYSASVDGLSLAVLNPVISHKHLSITSGYMRSAEIRSVIRNGVAGGKVVMQYQGLEIEVMKKDSGKTRKLASKIANMLLNEDNTKADPSTFITGEINLVRNRQEEYFAFIWHSIQTGLLPTILPAYERLNMKPGRT